MKDCLNTQAASAALSSGKPRVVDLSTGQLTVVSGEPLGTASMFEHALGCYDLQGKKVTEYADCLCGCFVEDSAEENVVRVGM